MTRVSIPVTQVTRSGVAPGSQIPSNAVSKMQLDSNDGITIVEMVSSDVASQTVAFEIPETVDSQAVTSKTVTLPAGATRYAGPFPTSIYNQVSQQLYITPSIGTTIGFRAYSISG